MKKMNSNSYSFLFFMVFFVSGCENENFNSESIFSQIENMENITIHSHEEVVETDSVRLIKDISFGDTEDVIIGRILGFQVDKNGRVYINDGAREARTIHVYEPDGTYIKNLGPYGKGPGDFSAPGTLRFYSDKLYVFDYNLNRLTSYSISSLELLESYKFDPDMIDDSDRIKEMRFFEYYFLDEDTLLVGFKKPQKYFDNKPGSYHYFITDIGFNKLGEEVFKQDALLENWGEVNGMRIMQMFPFDEKPLRTVSKTGRIFTAKSNNFLINEYSSDGNLVGGFFIPIEKKKVTRKDALSVSNEMTIGIARDIDLPENWPVLNSIFTDDKERIWVSTFTDNDKEVQWWILSPYGEIIARFRLPGNRYAEPRISNNIINTAHNGFYYSREVDKELGTEKITRYQIHIVEN